MSDTIELLNTIGQDASLRHASAEQLAHTLEQVNASDAFKAAAVSGDTTRLSEELGHGPMHVVQHSQTPGHEEDEPDNDDDSDESDGPDNGKS